MIPDNASDTISNITHTTAVGAILSPLWIHTLSDAAAVALPLLGVLWLALQAGILIYDTFWKKPNS